MTIEVSDGGYSLPWPGTFLAFLTTDTAREAYERTGPETV